MSLLKLSLRNLQKRRPLKSRFKFVYKPVVIFIAIVRSSGGGSTSSDISSSSTGFNHMETPRPLKS